MNFITLVLSRFNLLAANHLITCERTKFDTEDTSLKFLLEIMTLVSSANNNSSHIQFILKGRSFIYIMNYTSLGNSMFQCNPVSEKHVSCIM
jgi:hypothetical protein